MTDRTRKLISPIVSAAVLAFVFLIALTGAAWAATVASPDDGNLIDLARPVFEAIVSGKPGVASGLALVFLAAVARRYGGKRWAFLNTDAGGALLVLVGSFGGFLAAALTGGASFSLSMVYKVIAMAVSAAGGYSLVKRLIIEPIVRPLMKRAPAWMQPIFALIMWVFDKPDPVAEAVAAGDAAVAAKPPTGSAGVVGDARDVR